MINNRKLYCLDVLRQQILSLTLEPGSNLDETKLGQEFGISRTPLREILQKLAGEGYVDLTQNKSAEVVAMDMGVMRTFFQTVPLIYTNVARLAAENRIGNTHDSSFRDRFPMLKNVTMDFRWGGRLCLSRNSGAAFGEIAPGLFSACYQNGLGTAKGTLHGMLAAELASEHSSGLLSNIMNQAEPKRLPPSPIAWLGLNALLKCGEFKAGADL